MADNNVLVVCEKFDELYIRSLAYKLIIEFFDAHRRLSYDCDIDLRHLKDT